MNITSDEREGLPSASGFDVEHRCLRYRTRFKELGLEKKTSEVAQRGTDKHSYLEGVEIDLSPEDKEAADKIAENRDRFLEYFEYKNLEIIKEKRFWRTHPLGGKLWSAKIDAHVISSDCVAVINYKSGFSQLLNAKTSKQLNAEMVALATSIPSKVYHGALVTQFSYDCIIKTYDELMDDGDKIDRLVGLSQDPSMPYTTGYIQCLYCPIRKAGGCPAQSSSLDIPSSHKELGVNRARIGAMTPEQRRDLYDGAKIAMAKFKELDEILGEYASDGKIADYYSKKFPKRVLKATVKEIKDSFPLLSMDSLLEECSITMKGLDKLKVSEKLENMGLISKIESKRIYRK